MKVRRLDDILALHCPEVAHIDLVSIDVEVYEIEVMRGFTPARFGSSVIVMENLFHDESYDRFMRNIGYRVHSRSHHNYISVPSVGRPAAG